MTRTVKLMDRTPAKNMVGDMRVEYVHGVEGPDQAVVMVYRAAHDAAPEDAIKALEGVVCFLSDIQRSCVQDDPYGDVRCEHCGSDDKMIQVVADGYEDAHEPWCIVRKARELRAKLRATESGAALIRQAEGRHDG
jgi:hypothetical protein